MPRTGEIKTNPITTRPSFSTTRGDLWPDVGDGSGFIGIGPRGDLRQSRRWHSQHSEAPGSFVAPQSQQVGSGFGVISLMSATSRECLPEESRRPRQGDQLSTESAGGR